MPFAMTLNDNKGKVWGKMKGLIMLFHVHLGRDGNLCLLNQWHSQEFMLGGQT